jgi:hypothetical protein
MPRSLSRPALLAALIAALGPLLRSQEQPLQPSSPWLAAAEEIQAEEAQAEEAASAPGTVRFPRVAPTPPPPRPQEQPQDAPPPAPPQGEQRRLRTWELPTVEVVGSGLKEEERVGEYKQPRWSVERLFPTTRIYVLPEGAIHGELWTRVEEPRHGDTRIRDYYEVEFGLPNRFQVDLYLVADHTGEWEPGAINQQMIEGRYAFADWDEIWGNPTVYLEYIHRNDDPESVEGKLLLGGEAGPGWHWGTNLACEQEVGGERERELQISSGLSRTIIDDKFSLGVESKIQQTDEKEDRSDNENVFEVGPSMRWLPTDRAHVDFTPLIGIGPDSPGMEVFLIVGWEF